MSIFNFLQTNSQKRENLENLKQLTLEQIPYLQINNFLEKGQSLENIQIFQTINKSYGFQSLNYQQYKRNTNKQCTVIDYSKWLKQELGSFMMSPQKFLMQKNMKKAFIIYPKDRNKIKFTNVSSFEKSQEQWLTNIIENLTRDMLIEAFKVFKQKITDIPSNIKNLLLKPMKFSKIGKIEVINEQNLREKVEGITKNIIQIVQLDALAYIADNIIEKNGKFFPHELCQRVQAQKLKNKPLEILQKDKYEMMNKRRNQYFRRQDPIINIQYKETQELPSLLSISDEVSIEKKPSARPNILEKCLTLLKSYPKDAKKDNEMVQQSNKIIQQNNQKFIDEKLLNDRILAQNRKKFSEIQIQKKFEQKSQLQKPINKRKIRIIKPVQFITEQNVQTIQSNIEKMDIQSGSQLVKPQAIKSQFAKQDKLVQKTGIGIVFEAIKKQKNDQQIDKQQGFNQKSKYRFVMLNQPVKIKGEQNPFLKQKQQIYEKVTSKQTKGSIKIKSFKKIVDTN